MPSETVVADTAAPRARPSMAAAGGERFVTRSAEGNNADDDDRRREYGDDLAAEAVPRDGGASTVKRRARSQVPSRRSKIETRTHVVSIRRRRDDGPNLVTFVSEAPPRGR